MACASDKRRIEFRCTYFVLLVLVFAVLCSGCDPYYNNYPHDKATGWICTNPFISLSYNTDSNGTLSQEEILIWEELTLEIDLVFQSNLFTMYPANTTSHDERLISGSWYYRNGNLILTIDEDFIFEHQFKELVLEPKSKTD